MTFQEARDPVLSCLSHCQCLNHGSMGSMQAWANLMSNPSIEAYFGIIYGQDLCHAACPAEGSIQPSLPGARCQVPGARCHGLVSSPACQVWPGRSIVHLSPHRRLVQDSSITPLLLNIFSRSLYLFILEKKKINCLFFKKHFLQYFIY